MSRIAEVLRGKGSAVATIHPDAPVSELLTLLVTRNIGAVVVISGEAVAGIVSEGDVVERVHRHGADLLSVPVSEIMTSDVVTCLPEDEVDNLMRIMTNRRIRHLPVVVDGALAGIVSIGDLVKARIGELEEERASLHSHLATGS